MFLLTTLAVNVHKAVPLSATIVHKLCVVLILEIIKFPSFPFSVDPIMGKEIFILN